MSLTAQLHVLKEEEKVLVKLATKLNDQLNRLKVNFLTISYGWLLSKPTFCLPFYSVQWNT